MSIRTYALTITPSRGRAQTVRALTETAARQYLESMQGVGETVARALVAGAAADGSAVASCASSLFLGQLELTVETEPRELLSVDVDAVLESLVGRLGVVRPYGLQLATGRGNARPMLATYLGRRPSLWHHLDGTPMADTYALRTVDGVEYVVEGRSVLDRTWSPLTDVELAERPADVRMQLAMLALFPLGSRVQVHAAPPFRGQRGTVTGVGSSSVTVRVLDRGGRTEYSYRPTDVSTDLGRHPFALSTTAVLEGSTDVELGELAACLAAAATEQGRLDGEHAALTGVATWSPLSGEWAGDETPSSLFRTVAETVAEDTSNYLGLRSGADRTIADRILELSRSPYLFASLLDLVADDYSSSYVDRAVELGGLSVDDDDDADR